MSIPKDKEFQEAANKFFMENMLDPFYKELFPEIAHRFREVMDRIMEKGEAVAKQESYSKSGQVGMGGVVAAVAIGSFSALCEAMMSEYTGTTKVIADECKRATLELMNEVDEDEPTSQKN